jgi:hypothetical protein
MAMTGNLGNGRGLTSASTAPILIQGMGIGGDMALCGEDPKKLIDRINRIEGRLRGG